MKTAKHTTLALALLALVALLAGCGGGGGGETTEATASTTVEAPPKLSKAELISQGDAICAEVNAAVGSTESDEGITDEASQIAGLYTGMVERLMKLGAPNETEGYAELSEAAEDLAKVEGEVKLAAEREDTVALEAAGAEAVPALESFQSQAAAYGFDACGEGPSAPAPSAGGTSGGESSGGSAEEGGGVEPEAEYVEPEYEEPAPEEAAPETGGAGGAPEAAPETGGGAETGGGSGGIGPG
jgi:hypothetical protein